MQAGEPMRTSGHRTCITTSSPAATPPLPVLEVCVLAGLGVNRICQSIILQTIISSVSLVSLMLPALDVDREGNHSY